MWCMYVWGIQREDTFSEDGRFDNRLLIIESDRTCRYFWYASKIRCQIEGEYSCQQKSDDISGLQTRTDTELKWKNSREGICAVELL